MQIRTTSILSFFVSKENKDSYSYRKTAANDPWHTIRNRAYNGTVVPIFEGYSRALLCGKEGHRKKCLT